MKELSVSEAQKQFTSLLSGTGITTIVDKKSHLKKAVLMPYAIYEKLLASANINDNHAAQELDQFVGLFSEALVTDDARYNAIIKPK